MLKIYNLVTVIQNSCTYHLWQKTIHKEPEQGHSQQRNETFFLSNKMIFWPKKEKDHLLYDKGLKKKEAQTNVYNPLN